VLQVGAVDIVFWNRLSFLSSMAYCANRNLNPTTGSGTTRTVAHATPAFLPWHRVFSRMLERSLQVAIGDNELGLPYWDWVQGWSGMEQYFGGDGDPNNQNLLKDGPFVLSKWQLPEIYPFPLKGVMRKLGDDSGYRFPAQQEIDQMLQLRAYDLPPFSDVGNTNSFRNMIEGWGNGNHHNGIHRWLGGTMNAVVHSFNDPIFQVHHCNVDRIWTQWQQQHQCDNGHGSAVCYRPGETDPDVNQNTAGAQRTRGMSGQDRWAIVGGMFGDAMYPWLIRTDQALAAHQGYQFLAPTDVPPKTNGIDDTGVGRTKKKNGAASGRESSVAVVMAAAGAVMAMLF
jgi:hypothetical protein